MVWIGVPSCIAWFIDFESLPELARCWSAGDSGSSIGPASCPRTPATAWLLLLQWRIFSTAESGEDDPEGGVLQSVV
ncbi:hypothetical protein EV2_027008 [Malus domestica]